MSHFLDRLSFFMRPKAEFAGGHGGTSGELFRKATKSSRLASLG